ncbi:hypothetical protein [Nocardia cyriacigeorgica]|uniref:Uncharacterized protein n=1 Tax=Nocardia cyriacigeorgica TaxID=135487 RepID=A0A5R8NP95_9NOCA|nr:hypothetical protein [Nocardia cyriacigeorgica]TLF77502.1 hypothetical protein FEK34_14325 [Nocardia cyriacigeorgica]TLG15569.1 hypothetical protein FEK35_05295 [Nocardia cyriacigeorgica]
MTTAAETLSRTLGAALPPEFAALGDEQLAELDRMLHAASDRRSQQMREAFDSGLRLIPRLMRPAVKKALGL